MKAFQVDLKACLGLVIPDQYYPIVKIEVGFRVILLRGPRLLLCRPYYEPLLWFMIDDFARALNSKKQVDTDFSKAFDKVPHVRLAKKVGIYGTGNKM